MASTNRNALSLKKILIYSLIPACFPLLAFLQMNMINVANQYLAQELSLNDLCIASLTAIYLYADALMLIPVGLLLDRYTERAILLTGYSILFAGVLIFSFSNSYFFSIIGRFVAGLGHAFALLTCFKLVVQHIPEKNRGFFMGLTLTIALIGGLISQWPAAYLVAIGGMQLFFNINILVLSLVFLLMVFLIPKERGESKEKQNINISTINQGLWLQLKNQKIWSCAGYICLLSMPLMILGALFGVDYLSGHYDLSYIDASFATSMLFAGLIVGSPILGAVADKMAEKSLAKIAPLLIVCLLFAVHLIAMSYFLLIFSLFMIGFLSSSQVLGYKILSQSVSLSFIGVAMGVSNVIVMAGTATLQMLFSYFYTYTSAYAFYFIILLVLSGYAFVKPMTIKNQPGSSSC